VGVLEKSSTFMNRILYLALCGLLFAACSHERHLPEGQFGDAPPPAPPDYNRLGYWAAHPDKADNADRCPGDQFENKQGQAQADVFFLYPTLYTGDKEKSQTQWNAPVDDPKFNDRVDETSILNQASVFNGTARVFSPRYRQAHIHSYFTKDKASRKQAFELAYSDVRTAFSHYLEHHNNGRPIIIASHSQGTTHAGPLMREFFDGKPLAKQLVAAYVVGIEVPADYFKELKPCQTPTETGCFCSWRTWERGHLPKNHPEGNNYVVTNPLTWRTDTIYAPRNLNKGSVLYKFDKGPRIGICDAQVCDGVLWVNKPRFFGSAFVKMKNYHVADYNLFYANIRENAAIRVRVFLDNKKT
jgi:hypothetical protein